MVKAKTLKPRGMAMLLALCTVSTAHALDTFEPSSSSLQLGFVTLITGGSYATVVANVTGYEILGVEGGAAKSNTFDPSTNILNIGAIAVDRVTYNNVRVRLTNYRLLNTPTKLLSSDTVVQMTSKGEVGSLQKNTPEYNGFMGINAVRVAGGFGATTQHKQLDAAAMAHQKYLQAGEVAASGTSETQGVAGFTGATPTARCAYQGFSGACFEVATGTLSAASIHTYDMAQPWTKVIHDLQTLLDYRNVMMGTRVQQGMAHKSATPWVYKAVWTAARANVQLPMSQANNVVGVYPSPDMNNVGIGASAEAGSIILAQFPDDTNPVVTAFTLRKDGATADHPLKLVTAGESTAAGAATQPGWAIAQAQSPLHANSRYTATLTGTWKGHQVNKTWSFTTGTTVDTSMLR